MRVLVVGTAPPPGGVFAQRLGDVAAQLSAEGNDVDVLSPDLRSASHRHARLSGLWLSAQLLRFARRFDGLVLRIERDVPCGASSGRMLRAVTLLSLGAVLRCYRDVTLRLDTPVPIPGGLGGRAARELWAHASRIVVATEEDAKNLRAVPGIDATRITLEPLVAPVSTRHFDGWDVDPAGNLRADVLAQVRARATRDRQAQAANQALHGERPGSFGGFDGSATRENRPLVPSLTSIARVVASRVQRAITGEIREPLAS